MSDERKDNKRTNRRGNKGGNYGSGRAVTGSKPILGDNTISTLINNVGNIDFNYPAGTFTTLHSNYCDGFSIPGVMAIDVAPTLGTCGTPSDAVNRAMIRYFMTARAKKSYNTDQYEPCDIGLMTLAFGSVYAYLRWLIRLYKIARTHSATNIYVPRALAAANRCNYDDLRDKLPILLAGINEISSRLAAYNVLGTLPAIYRYANLFEGIIAESDSIRDQMYMFVPLGFHRYEWKTEDDDTRGMLTFVTLADLIVEKQRYLTVADLLEFGHALVDNIESAGELRILSSDIGDAFPSDQFLQWPIVAENPDPVSVGQSPDMLNDLLNAKVFALESGCLDIVQDTYQTATGPVGVIKQTVRVSKDADAAINNAQRDRLISDSVMTMPNANVTVEEVFRTSHWMPVAKYTDAEVLKLPEEDREPAGRTLSCGSTIITNIRIYTLDRFGEPHEHQFFKTDVFKYVDDYPTHIQHLKELALYRQFKYAPNIFIYDAGTSDIQDVTFFGMVDNYTLIDHLKLARMHDIEMLATFNV